ncbi:hypothetical protein MHYP_G00104090 [Metynnis hypsauchen]
MSCLWSWCCRVREDSDTDSERKVEEKNEHRKKGKKKKSRKIQGKKGRKNKKKEEQQPGKVEEETVTLDLPVGLESSSQKNVSAEKLKTMAPPLTEETETIKSSVKTLLVEARMEQLLEEPVKTFPSAESEAKDVTDLMEVVLEDVETHSATSAEKEVKMMMLTDAAEAEAMKAFMDVSLDENEEEHLDHLVSSDDVGKSISELLEVLFEDAISASVQPLAENEMISKVAAEVEPEAKAVDALMSVSVEDEKEEHLDEPLVSSDDVGKSISELLEVLFKDAISASVQPLEYEAVKIMEATEVAAEASNKMKTICLEGSGDKPLEKHLDHLVSSDDVRKSISELLEVLFEDVLSAGVQPLAENEIISKVAAEAKVEAHAKAVNALMSISVEDEKEEHLDEPLDNLVSITGDKTDVISELLDIQLENPASVQPLEYEAVKLMEAAEVAAEASNNMKCISLEGSGDKPLEKHLGHLVSSDDVLKSISELLEVLFEDAISAGVQPLAENEMILKGATETKGDAEASDSFMNISVKDEKEEDLDEPLDNPVSITGDETDVISELLDIQLEHPVSVQPLEYEAEMMMEVFAAQVAKHDLTFLATKAPKELLFTPLEVIEEESEEEPENKPLAEMDVNKRDPPEEPETRKKRGGEEPEGKGEKSTITKTRMTAHLYLDIEEQQRGSGDNIIMKRERPHQRPLDTKLILISRGSERLKTEDREPNKSSLKDDLLNRTFTNRTLCHTT